MNVRLIRSLSRRPLLAVMVALLPLSGYALAQLPPGGPPGSPAALHHAQILQANPTEPPSRPPSAPAVDPRMIASTPPAPGQLPPAALPGVIQPNMNPPGTAGTQTPPAATTPIAAVDAKPATAPAEQKSEVGRMVLGEKIDVLTLADLQDKLQATPDMILTLSGHTYRMSLLGDFTKSLATISAMTSQSPVAQSPGRQ